MQQPTLICGGPCEAQDTILVSSPVFDLKIHPAEKHPWYYRQYVFTRDHLEALFQELNKFHDNSTMLVAGSFGVYTIDSSVSKTEVSHCFCLSISWY